MATVVCCWNFRAALRPIPKLTLDPAYLVKRFSTSYPIRLSKLTSARVRPENRIGL